jgi:hypothetical protein
MSGAARRPGLLLGLAALALCTAAAAELTLWVGDPPSPGNLAAQASLRSAGTAGVARYVLRGPIPPEGSPRFVERSVAFASRGGEIELDFERLRRVAGILLVADADDRYEVLASSDGRAWRRIFDVPPAAERGGLRARWRVFEAPVEAHALRVRPLGGKLAVLAALRVYAELPPGWPLAIRESSRGAWPLVREEGMRPFVAARLFVAVLGAGALLVLVALEHRRASPRWRRHAERVLAAAALLAGLCWWDFFQSGAGAGYFWTHHNYWDVHHYYLGPKFAPELGYTNLYHCALIADFEDGFAELYGPRDVARELRDNRLVPVAEVARDPGRCLDAFSPARWQRFKRDVAFFRTHLPPSAWARLTIDHGYNGSPAWTLLGGAVARLVPLSDAGFAVLMALDTLLLVALWGAAWRTFGTRAVSLALLFWGTSWASGPSWTQGAFLRQAWLFLLVVGLCRLARGGTASAGALLALATLLRLFPAFHVLGVALRALCDALAARRLALGRARARFVAGGLAATALLGALSLAGAGDPQAWQEFARNTRKHFGVTAVNTMGVAALTDWRAALAAPGSPEAEATTPDAQAIRRLRLATALLVAPLLLLALRRQPDWVAAILASAWIPFVTDLGSYYYAYLATFGFLAGVRSDVGLALALLSVALAAVGVAYDGEQVRGAFVWSSAAVVAFCVAVPLLLALRPQPRAWQ